MRRSCCDSAGEKTRISDLHRPLLHDGTDKCRVRLIEMERPVSALSELRCATVVPGSMVLAERWWSEESFARVR